MILSVNIDHIATLRNARNSSYPSLLRAISIVKEAGAGIVTIHLREDRRHIRDNDAKEICESGILPVNFEIASTEEMVAKALELKPKFVCFVPEKREEVTTEGGLDLVLNQEKLIKFTNILKEKGIEVSFFVDPEVKNVELAKKIGANSVEFHTGKFADFDRKEDFERIKEAAILAKSLGLNVHAGHGLTFDSAEKIAKIHEISTLHIGHFLITESIFLGLSETIRRFLEILR